MQMNSRLTEKAQEAVAGAQQLAASAGHPAINPEHLLVTLVEQQDGVVPALLRALDVDVTALAAAAHRRGRRRACAMLS